MVSLCQEAAQGLAGRSKAGKERKKTRKKKKKKKKKKKRRTQVNDPSMNDMGFFTNTRSEPVKNRREQGRRQEVGMRELRSRLSCRAV